MNTLPPVTNRILTPEEAFGEATTLATAQEQVAGIDPAIFGGAFQAIVICITLVYMFFIIRYWNFVRYFLLSSVGIKTTKRSQTHINPGEQYNLEVVMIVVGVIFWGWRWCAVADCGCRRPSRASRRRIRCGLSVAQWQRAWLC